jgi:starch synthase
VNKFKPGAVKVGLLTREFPPDVYGGGGVHVEFMSRALAACEVEVQVHCLGAPRAGAMAHAERDPRLADAHTTLHVLAADLSIVAELDAVDLVHSHTWYAAMAGRWSQQLYQIPHVITAHSLEPLRPWKAEQLGAGGYQISCWAERSAVESADAIIAVSEAMRTDILTCYPAVDSTRVHVIPNGVDSHLYHRDANTVAVEQLGIDLHRPYVAFVGRTARQKGIDHLLRATLHLDPDVQVLLVLGAADHPALAREIADQTRELQLRRPGVHVVPRWLPREHIRQILTHAAVFCCPSIYEPQGIVNLEAMACQTAVVASDVGGIPDVLRHGTTGLLVHYDPADPTRYQRELAAALNELLHDPARAAEMGRAGRRRAIDHFSWKDAAERTAHVYADLVKRWRSPGA